MSPTVFMLVVDSQCTEGAHRHTIVAGILVTYLTQVLKIIVSFYHFTIYIITNMIDTENSVSRNCIHTQSSKQTFHISQQQLEERAISVGT